MAFDFSSLANFGGAALGAVSSFLGQGTANVANVRSAREQMAFQERMSNTSWQRGVQDMRKAGINPMLAVSKGGASTPTGASSVSQSTTSGIPQSISSAVQLATLKANLEKLDSEIASNRAFAELQRQQKANYKQQNDINKPIENMSATWWGRALPYLNTGADVLSSAASIANPMSAAFRAIRGTSSATDYFNHLGEITGGSRTRTR